MSRPVKRTRDADADAADGPAPEMSSQAGSSLPPSSPPMPFSDFGDEEEPWQRDEVQDLPEEEDGEDLFGPNMERDYAGNDEQDAYDPDDIDDVGDYGDLSAAERRAVDARLARRDRELARESGRRPAAFLDGSDDEEMDLTTTRRRRHQYDEDPDQDGDLMDEDMSSEAIADVKADSVAEWVSVDQVRRAIAREFKKFLLEYTDEQGTSVYGQRIRTLGEVNSESLEVSYAHLAEARGTLALFLATAPEEMLKILDLVAMEATLLFYPDYERIHAEIHVRVTDLPKTHTLRELRQVHLNGLVKVSGVVTRRSGVNPQLKYVKFDCLKCGTILGPFFQDAVSETRISYCENCQSRGPFNINSEKTVYRNYQNLILQESPGTVPAGRLPRNRKVILLWDLVDAAKPGEEIEITGIYRNQFDASLNSKNGFPVFSTIIEANHVNKAHDQFAAFRLSEQDEKSIRALSKDPQIIQRIISSIAPSIYGHRDIKTAIALSLFGGVPKDINGKHRIRGDINLLLLGDPGTAKSQFLKYVEKTAHRAVFTTGQGASAVGLTASVRKDPITSEWTLEGGALVLADKGTCLIDEFDKMNDQDRTSIHEAMEQQSISVSKAGIVTTLQARCAIMAAANPIGGRYNATIPFSQNVELTEPILSRFDVLCVVRDTVDPAIDERLARFVVGSHLRSHPKFDSTRDELIASSNADAEDAVAEPIPQDLLKKYIVYAREHMQPKLHQMDTDKVSKLYSDMRRESLKTGSFPITVRHLESIIRISESLAKMQLSEFVRQRHIDEAIRVTIDSFVNANKLSVKKSLAKSFAKYTLPPRARAA